MSTIQISNLHPTGSELFSDSESYMNELGVSELNSINGGSLGIVVRTAVQAGKYVYSVAVRNSHRIPRPDPTKVGGFNNLINDVISKLPF